MWAPTGKNVDPIGKSRYSTHGFCRLPNVDQLCQNKEGLIWINVYTQVKLLPVTFGLALPKQTLIYNMFYRFEQIFQISSELIEFLDVPKT